MKLPWGYSSGTMYVELSRERGSNTLVGVDLTKSHEEKLNRPLLEGLSTSASHQQAESPIVSSNTEDDR